MCFMIFGSVIGLKFFTLNYYSIQLVFYFIYTNLANFIGLSGSCSIFKLRPPQVGP
ncbi:unnamed protein product, partial [Vitis vinifera]|uniref:Uncharacterized protein n=1 Tax=Vitis vinifera TaxID=29760 RepID=D7T3S6_VITVI